MIRSTVLNAGTESIPQPKQSKCQQGGASLIIGGAVSFIFFFLSIWAITQIHSWYPPLVAQGWSVYDQPLVIFTLMGFLFGVSASLLAGLRRTYRWTMFCAVVCTFSGLGSLTISMIIPFASLWYSFFYYFLPLFIMPLAGTVLIYPRKAEFRQ
jgi:hypothetical protein